MIEAHEYADVFPMLPDEQALELEKSIMENGLRHPIILYHGKILDGRNRYAACMNFGIEPRFTQFEGTDDQAMKLVIDENINRRHMTPGQLAIVAAKIANIRHGGDMKQCTNSDDGVTLQEAADRMGVGRTSAATAKRLIDKEPELADLVDRGHLTLNAADKASQLSEPDKAEVVNSSEPKETLREKTPPQARMVLNQHECADTLTARQARKTLGEVRAALSRGTDLSKGNISALVDRLDCVMSWSGWAE